MFFAHLSVLSKEACQTLANGDTVPTISFKMDILAANVNFMNVEKQAFFNILSNPFEL